MSGNDHTVKLRHYLLLLVTVAALPLVVFATVALQRLRESERLALHLAALEATQSIAFQIDRDLARAEASLKALSQSPTLITRDWSAMRRQAAMTSSTAHSWTVVFDESGRQVVNTRIPVGQSLPGGGTPPGFSTLITTSAPTISGVFTGSNTGKPLMRVDLPTQSNDGRRYLLTMVFEAEYFRRLIQQRPLPSTWIAAIFDQQGVTLARSHRSEEFVGKPAGAGILKAARAASQGRVRTVTREGIPLYDTFVVVPRTGWVVANGVPASELEETSDQALGLALAGFAVALAGGVAIASLLAWRLNGAFGQLAGAVQVIGSDAFPSLPTVPTRDLQALQVNVQAAHRRLQEERARRAEAEAQREVLFTLEQNHRLRAEQDNRAKDEFIAMLGHELRNPLSAIQGAVAAMARRAGESDLTVPREMIKRQSAHLARLVDDLLDVNRVLRGKIEMHFEPLDLAHIAEAAVASFRAAGRLTDRHVDTALSSVWIQGDGARLEQVVGNLLSNAVKFTRPGGRIGIELRADGDKAVLTVSDDGAGMSPTLVQSAFELFVQGPTTPDRAQGGLGIGLALVRRLTIDHQGDVIARSDGAGLGATFTLLFPRIEPTADAGGTKKDVASTRVASAPPQEEPMATAGCKVLIIEDQADVREALSILLELEGHQVWTAPQGETALGLIERIRFEAAIIDIGLPGLDGYEIARLIRARADGQELRLIALTGYGQRQDAEASNAAGFDLHMVKPVNADRLLAVLGELPCRPA